MEYKIYYPLIKEVAIAPDGKQVVYGVQEPSLADEESKFISHLYLTSIEGNEPIQLTIGQHSNYCPRWSPDGRYIAFISNRSGKANIYVISPVGGEARALTNTESEIATLKWSPDGSQIAFLMSEPRSPEKDKPILWDVDFSFTHLYSIPFNTAPRQLAKVTQITTGHFHLTGFDWFPDGQTVAVIYRPTPSFNDWTQTRLATVPAADSQAYKLEDLKDIAIIADPNLSPLVSPDGNYIACVTGDRPIRWSFNNRIVLYSTKDRPPRPLSSTPNGQCQLIGWSSDSSLVMVLEFQGIDTQVWSLPVSGEAGKPLTDSKLFKSSVNANKSNSVVFVGEDFDRPNSLYSLDISTGKETNFLTLPLPQDWPDLTLPKTEVIRWTAPNDLEIEGILTYPQNYQPGRAYPLIVNIHGGPSALFLRLFLGSSLKFSIDVLELAARGFVILQPNPRGSSGYGKEFRCANDQDWGGGDYQDIMAGVDRLIDRGLVDPERMGVMGWSYGGYMTSWIITQSDRFSAACVGAGVTNLISFTGTADIPSFIPDFFGAEFWDNPDIYKSRSPIFQVKGVKTPTLILHGEEDKRVPLAQGKELYNALKRQGVTTEMIIYPRQEHRFTDPRFILDLRQRILDWFDRFVLAK